MPTLLIAHVQSRRLVSPTSNMETIWPIVAVGLANRSAPPSVQGYCCNYDKSNISDTSEGISFHFFFRYQEVEAVWRGETKYPMWARWGIMGIFGGVGRLSFLTRLLWGFNTEQRHFSDAHAHTHKCTLKHTVSIHTHTHAHTLLDLQAHTEKLSLQFLCVSQGRR